MIQNIQLSIDKGLLAAGIACDLSKAFDCVSHTILLDKLYAYGIRGIANKWIASYLSNRSQFVQILTKEDSKVSSNCATVRMGVPQGSILGPLLFLIYVNDLPTFVKETTIIMFADDTSALINAKSIKELSQKGNEVLSGLNHWFNENNLLLNVAKTCLLHFKNNYNQHEEGFTLKTDTTLIATSKSVKFLGIMIDESLKWDAHELFICGKLKCAIYSIFKLRDLVSKNVLKTVYYSYFYSIATYGISAWGHSSAALTRVFLLQKNALRIMYRYKRRKSCKAIFREENILTIPGAFVLESLLHVFQNRHNFKVNHDIHKHNTRHADDFVTIQHRTKYFEKGIHFMGIKFFNHLPANLKSLKCFKTFRRNVKSLLVKSTLYSSDEFFSVEL